MFSQNQCIIHEILSVLECFSSFKQNCNKIIDNKWYCAKILIKYLKWVV